MNPNFIEMIRRIGDQRLADLPDVLSTTEPEVSVRINPRRPDPVPPVLQGSEPVAWLPDAGRYLPAPRPRFTSDPAMHQGRYYVQDASSMIITALARAVSRRINREMESDAPLPLLWLDACAAPGGKSTAAADGLPEGSLVVSNEYDYQRAEILRENLYKWGNPSSMITRGDTRQFRHLPETFDVIAVDAPCSGEGMMRKDATARSQWTPALTRQCAETQHEILSNLWDALRPGGYLIYSTCTFNTLENEQMILRLREEFGAESIDMNDPGDPTIAAIDGAVEISGIAQGDARRFIPGRIRGEGLFVALLRKPGELHPAVLSLSARNQKKQAKEKMQPKGVRGGNSSVQFANKEALAKAARWILPEKLPLLTLRGTPDGVSAFPALWEGFRIAAESALQVISAGVEVAQLRGKDLVPTHQLALSSILNAAAFPQAQVPLDQALAYLARESVSLPASAPRGYVLLTFDALPLGFVNNLGNRYNSLLPKEWRIRFKS